MSADSSAAVAASSTSATRAARSAARATFAVVSGIAGNASPIPGRRLYAPHFAAAVRRGTTLDERRSAAGESTPHPYARRGGADARSALEPALQVGIDPGLVRNVKKVDAAGL